MTDDLQDALVDKFFDPVINAKSLEALRSWLRKQPTDEIEMFLAFFNFEDFEADGQSWIKSCAAVRNDTAPCLSGSGLR